MGQVVQVSSLPWGTFTNATKGGRAPSGSQFCGGRKVGWQSRTVAGHIAPQEAETACEEREQEVGLGWGLSPPSTSSARLQLLKARLGSLSLWGLLTVRPHQQL